MTDAVRHDFGAVTLQSGITLPEAQITYQTYGELNPARDNVIVYPTSYGAHHTDIEWTIGPGRPLDPERYFIIIPNMLCNGLSSSPSNTAAPLDRGRFPLVTTLDNVRLQARLLEDAFGVERIAMVYGWSMGGQQAYHWAAAFPDRVARMVCLCGSARTAPHNKVFLEGVRAALMADAAFQDGWFSAPPVRGLRAFGRLYAGWALSHAFYRETRWADLGYGSHEDFLNRYWEANFSRRDANDLLAQSAIWMQSDIADNALYGGDLDAALGAITAKALIMPGDHDLYFRVEDNRREVAKMPNATLKVIPSLWGHRAGNPSQSPTDDAFINEAVFDLLAD